MKLTALTIMFNIPFATIYSEKQDICRITITYKYSEIEVCILNSGKQKGLPQWNRPFNMFKEILY